MKDRYLIEYLVRNGYAREQVENPSFNIDSVEGEFAEPIELSQVENIDELKIFIRASSCFLVTQEDIDSGKVYKLSEILIDYKLICAEQGLKLDKLFYDRALYNINGSFQSKRIVLENFNLIDTEFISDTKKQMKFITSGKTLEDNKESTGEWPYPDAPSIELVNCNNIDLAKIDVRSLVIMSGDNIRASSAKDFENLELDSCNNVDLIGVSGNVLLKNFESIDMAELPNSCSYEISNVLKCFASEEVSFKEKISFRNVIFNESDKKISFEKVEFDECLFPEEKMKIDVVSVTIKNCNYNIAFNMDISKLCKMVGCYNYDERIEEFVDKKDKNGFTLEIDDPKDYDIRRLKVVLDLSDDKNSDLLEDVEKLKKVLENNKYLEYILVPERLSDEQKRILGDYAPDVNYDYGHSVVLSAGIGRKPLSVLYSFFDNEQEHVNFEQFIEADNFFEEIVSGINEEWSELQKFKYLYNELGSRISYDINAVEKYNDELESFDRANIVARNPFSTILSKNGICDSFAKIYQYVCRKAGLRCEMVTNSEHAWNLIEYTNEQDEQVQCYCDLTWDAMSIKNKTRCSNFGFGAENKKYGNLKTSAKKIPLEILKEIDNSIGYEYTNKRYLDIIKEINNIENIEERVNALLKNIMLIQDISNMSNREVVQFAQIMLLQFGMEFGKDVGGCTGFIRKDERADKDVREILWVKDTSQNKCENYLYYTFNSEQQAFKTLDKETVEELLAAGMLELYKGQEMPGFENWISEKEYQVIRNSGQDR